MTGVIDQVVSARRPLSNREVQVLRLVAAGYTRFEIGEQLHITERTVRTHVSRLLAAMCAVNAPHAVAIGFREGILS